MHRFRVDRKLGGTIVIGLFLVAGFTNSPQPFVGYDYVRPVRRFLPANRSPYEDLLNNNVYDSGPADLDVIPEPQGLPEEPYPASHFFSKSEPDLGAPPDIFGPRGTNSQ